MSDPVFEEKMRHLRFSKCIVFAYEIFSFCALFLMVMEFYHPILVGILSVCHTVVLVKGYADVMALEEHLKVPRGSCLWFPFSRNAGS